MCKKTVSKKPTAGLLLDLFWASAYNIPTKHVPASFTLNREILRYLDYDGYDDRSKGYIPTWHDIN